MFVCLLIVSPGGRCYTGPVCLFVCFGAGAWGTLATIKCSNQRRVPIAIPGTSVCFVRVTTLPPTTAVYWTLHHWALTPIISVRCRNGRTLHLSMYQERMMFTACLSASDSFVCFGEPGVVCTSVSCVCLFVCLLIVSPGGLCYTGPSLAQAD